MNPQEYAKEFIQKFDAYCYHEREFCALKIIDELIYFSSTELLSECFDGDYYCDEDFFIQVKKEIKKLC